MAGCGQPDGEAIRYVTVQRGSDPRDFDLVALGGGGPIHAYGIAQELGMRRIVVPTDPGLFSASGIASADFTHDYLVSYLRRTGHAESEELARLMASLFVRAHADLAREGVDPPARLFVPSLDLRYVGQSTEINITLPHAKAGERIDLEAFVAAFHASHERLYTYSVPAEPVELVNLRLRAIGKVPKGSIAAPTQAGHSGPTSSRPAWFPGAGVVQCPVWSRDRLPAGQTLRGPAIIQEMSSATIVPPDALIEMDRFGNLIVTLPQGASPPA